MTSFYLNLYFEVNLKTSGSKLQTGKEQNMHLCVLSLLTYDISNVFTEVKITYRYLILKG